MANKFIINKIPLKEFIDLLLDLYDNNVDFIDIVGEEESETQDSIKIGIRPEYYLSNENIEEEDNQSPATFSKDDFEKLT